MTALCGAIWWRDGRPGPVDLTGVQDVLAPYGRPETWSGEAGRCTVGVGVQNGQASKGRGPAMAQGSEGTLVVCADSHLHRAGALARSLGLPTMTSDAEIVLGAYERWGRSFLQHLSGSFALAVVDRRRGGVLLARDHAGDRTLAVHEGKSVVAFATTALALTGFPGVGHELDLDRAVEAILLAHGTDRTFVRGVRMVPPGVAIWVDGKGSETWRWWPTGDPAIVDAGSLRAHAVALHERLEDGVAATVAGARRVGVMLSGGLDSSSVAAVTARRLAPGPLVSYTSVPPPGWSGSVPWGWIPDERFAVEALAAFYPNLRPRFVETTPSSLFGHGEALWELGCPPVRNPMNVLWVVACYRMAADDGVDVLLSGAAGNLAFSADGPMWLFELARRGRLVQVAREAWRFSKEFDVDVVTVLRGNLLAHLLPGLKRRRHLRRGRDPLSEWLTATAIAPDRLASVDVSSLLPELADPRPTGIGRDPGRIFLGTGAQAELNGAVRARWGLDLRDPTADRHLVELAVTQPEWWRRHNGEWRAICRAAMRDALPTEIVDRPTLGAQQPEWLDLLTGARPEVLDELAALRDHPASCEVIDVARLDRLVKEWPDRSQMAHPRVVADYQLALTRAIALSRYMRWFEERGRRVRAGGPAVVVSND